MFNISSILMLKKINSPSKDVLTLFQVSERFCARVFLCMEGNAYSAGKLCIRSCFDDFIINESPFSFAVTISSALSICAHVVLRFVNYSVLEYCSEGLKQHVIRALLNN